MSRLLKKMRTEIIPGVAASPVVTKLATEAYSTVRVEMQEQWVDGPGITWEWVPFGNTAGTGAWVYTEQGELEWLSFIQDDILIGRPTGSWQPLYLGSRDIGNHPVKVKKLVAVQVVTHYPAQPATYALPKEPAKLNQIRYSLNAGWNSHAISIEPLAPGEFISFKVKAGTTGAFIGVGRSVLYGKGMTVFRHGIVAEPAGVRVVESGDTKTLLTSVINKDTDIRVYLGEDRIVSYVVINESIVRVAKSLVAAEADTLYAHAYLYSGGDEITEAAFDTGRVIYGGTR